MNHEKTSAELTERNKKIKGNGIFSVIYIFLLLEAAATGYIREYSFTQNLANIVITFVCIILLQFFFCYKAGENIREIYSKFLYVFLIGMSIVLIFVNDYKFIGGLWLISVALLSAVDGMKHGMLSCFLCLVSYLLYSEEYMSDANMLLYYVIMGAAMVFLFSGADMRELIYSSVSLLVFAAVFIMTAYEFDMHGINADRGHVMIRLLAMTVMAAVTIIVKYTIEKLKQNSLEYENRILHGLADIDSEAVIKLRSASESLYIHSVKVSSLSEKIAKSMGYDFLLAGAGGLYHEIGRIKKGGFEENTRKVSDEYKFTKELTRLILQNHLKKPGSKEAGVVLLSDSLISMSDYFRKNSDKAMPSKEKMIDGIFSNRIKKGNLDDCGFTLEELQKLRKLYEQYDMDFYAAKQ